MDINIGYLLAGVLVGILALFLSDFKSLMLSNKSVIEKEVKRYNNSFKGTSAEVTRRTATFGTKLELDDNGFVIIQAESRLSLDSYI